MKMAALLDIDNTLTPPRQPLAEEMAELLNRLSVPFHVAAGSHIALLQDQFFQPLYRYGFRKQFDAFLNNGATHYRCDYSEGMKIDVVSEFNIHDHLGDGDYKFLIQVLTQTLNTQEFQLPPALKVMGKQIINRGSMINFSPIGRVSHESAGVQTNRKNFVEFDLARNYRQRVMEHLRHELSSLVAEKELTITLGGQTSFDIGIANQDKANAVRELLGGGYERLIFIGDALFDGGNDAPIRRFVENWQFNEPCPLEVFQVDSWNDTVEILRKLGLVDRRDE